MSTESLESRSDETFCRPVRPDLKQHGITVCGRTKVFRLTRICSACESGSGRPLVAEWDGPAGERARNRDGFRRGLPCGRAMRPRAPMGAVNNCAARWILCGSRRVMPVCGPWVRAVDHAVRTCGSRCENGEWRKECQVGKKDTLIVIVIQNRCLNANFQK